MLKHNAGKARIEWKVYLKKAKGRKQRKQNSCCKTKHKGCAVRTGSWNWSIKIFCKTKRMNAENKKLSYETLSIYFNSAFETFPLYKVFAL